MKLMVFLLTLAVSMGAVGQTVTGGGRCGEQLCPDQVQKAKQSTDKLCPWYSDKACYLPSPVDEEAWILFLREKPTCDEGYHPVGIGYLGGGYYLKCKKDALVLNRWPDGSVLKGSAK